MPKKQRSLEQTITDFRKFLRDQDEPIGLYPALEAFIEAKKAEGNIYVHELGSIYTAVAAQELRKLAKKAGKAKVSPVCCVDDHQDYDRLRLELAESRGEVKALQKFAARFPHSIELDGIDCHIHKYLCVKDDTLVFSPGNYHLHGEVMAFTSDVELLPGARFIMYDESKLELCASKIACKGTKDKPVLFNSDGAISRAEIAIKGGQGDLAHCVFKDFITLANVLHLHQTELKFSNLSVISNYSDGAIIDVEDGTVVIEDSDISDNYTTCSRGCVIVQKRFDKGGSVAFNNCRITGNQSRKGAVHVYEGSTARFDTACILEGNTKPQISGDGETIYDPKIIKD